MSCKSPVIEVEGVKKCYRTYQKPIHRLWQSFRPNKRFYSEFWALKGIDLTVQKGETIGIVGKNGSGKSTLLQIIAGILQPTEGQFSTKGRISALLELGAGFNPEFTGLENARLNASIMGLSSVRDSASCSSRSASLAAANSVSAALVSPEITTERPR